MCDYYSRVHKLVVELCKNESISLSKTCADDESKLIHEHPAHIGPDAFGEPVEIPTNEKGSKYGRHLIRPSFFKISPKIKLLNNGSVGSCPDLVLNHQEELRQRMERQALTFFSDCQFAQARVLYHLGQELYHTRCENLVFVPNTISGIQSVVAGHLGAGDVLMILDVGFSGVRYMVERLAWRQKFKIQVISTNYPLSQKQILDKIRHSFKTVKNIKCLLIDHITSVTSFIMPIKQICKLCRENNIKSIVDGAHATGQISTNLPDLECDYYSSNLYKWAFAPKGAAILYARNKDDFDDIDPSIIGHAADYKGCGLAKFGWISCLDYTPWLASAKALRVIQAFGAESMRNRNHDLCIRAAIFLTRAIPGHVELVVGNPVQDENSGDTNTGPIAANGHLRQIPAIASFILSNTDKTAQDVLSILQNKFDIISHIKTDSDGRMVLRISAAVYNEEDDYVALANGLRHIFAVDDGKEVSHGEIARFKGSAGQYEHFWPSDDQ